jgi:hypothetical protein
MQAAQAIQPLPAGDNQVSEKIPATINQLRSLTHAIAEIDSTKHFEPNRLPSLLSQARIALDVINHNVLFPLRSAECEVSSEDLQEFQDCLKTMGDIITGGDVALLLPIVDTAYDILTRMAGEHASLVCPPETD